MGTISICSEPYREYIGEKDWEAVLTGTGEGENIIGADWQERGLCARFLSQGRALPLFSDGEYWIKKEENCRNKDFFIRQISAFFQNIQGGFFRSGRKRTVLLVSVPEPRLEAGVWRKYAGQLEEELAALPGDVQVIFFPRVQAVWRHCASLGDVQGVVQVLDKEMQILLGEKDVTAISFGSRLAGCGRPQRYYHSPVVYRENNFLYEPDRFLYEKRSCPSWYQAVSRILEKVFQAKGYREENGRLALTGDPDSRECVARALSDMDAVENRAALEEVWDVPSCLLEWYCSRAGLPFWAEGRKENGQREQDAGDIWRI